jgi:phosphate transport system substrate-binding protein
MTHRFAALAAAALVGSAGAAAAQDQQAIQIVGSSTVFPFATAVAERFGKTTDFPTPVIESTGSGGGMRLFCEGVGEQYPDITNASRRMKPSEFETCREAGVEDIVEVKIGYDGIAIANSVEGPALDLTLGEIYEALRAGSDAELWSDVNPALPQEEIEVLGPPPTSGTRDSFEELVMEVGCEEVGGDCDAIEIRADGAYVESGENDNLIVSKLDANPGAVGVFGYSFLEENEDKLQGSTIEGVEPRPETISSGEYPVSRSMFFYVKKPHVGVVPGVQEYAAEFVSDGAAAAGGYLAEIGLIPLPADELEEMQGRVDELTAMTGDMLN